MSIHARACALLTCAVLACAVPWPALAEEDEPFLYVQPPLVYRERVNPGGDAAAADDAQDMPDAWEDAVPDEDAPPATPRVRFVVTVGGDCVLGIPAGWEDDSASFDALMEGAGMAYPFSGLYAVTAYDDLTLINLEGPLTFSQDRQKKQFNFRGRPEYAMILQRGSVEAVNLANNHVLDYGQAGLEDTLSALAAYDITASGNGLLGIYEKDGVRVGMAGYTFPYPKSGKDISADVAALREAGCHIVLASFHWGSEYRTAFTAEQRRIGRAAIDAGADVVIGHHPHVIQGIERYKDRYILYSLGNLVFGGTRDPKDRDAYLAQLVFAVDRQGDEPTPPPELALLPVRFTGVDKGNDYRPIFPEEAVSDRIRAKILKLSHNMDGF